MKNTALRMLTMAVLGVLMLAGLLPETEQPRDAVEIYVSENRQPEEIYITIRSANAWHQEDGSSVIEVEFTTDTAEILTDMRMVTVFSENQKLTFALTGDNQEDIHRVSFKAAEQPETVQIEIRAHETQEGLLLISDGEGQLCGKASAPVNGDRILRLSGARPGATYQIYRIGELSEVLSGEWRLSEKPSVKERTP